MNLSLQPTATSVILTALVMAAGIWMSYIACKRNRRPLTFKLEILRLAILGFICFLLFQPEWIITSAPQEKPKVSILEDRSGSMETQDVEISPQHVVTRTAYVQELLKGNSTESLKDTHVVEYASFGAPPAPDSPDYAMAGTDLAKPLEDAMQSSDNLRAVIMFTDGSHNASSSVLTQAQRMRTRGIPLFIISAGSPYPLPDLALQDVKAPTYGIIGETVQIPFTIKSTLGKETRTTLIMTSRDTGKTVTRTVTIPAQGEVSDAVLWKIEKKGRKRWNSNSRSSPRNGCTIITPLPSASPAGGNPSKHWSSIPCRAGNTASSGTPCTGIPAWTCIPCSFIRNWKKWGKAPGTWSNSRTGWKTWPGMTSSSSETWGWAPKG